MQTNPCKVHCLPQIPSLLDSQTLGHYPPFPVTSSPGTLLGTRYRDNPYALEPQITPPHLFLPTETTTKATAHVFLSFLLPPYQPWRPMWCGMPPVSRTCEHKKLLPLWQSFPCYHGLPCMIKINSEYFF